MPGPLGIAAPCRALKTCRQHSKLDQCLNYTKPKCMPFILTCSVGPKLLIVLVSASFSDLAQRPFPFLIRLRVLYYIFTLFSSNNNIYITTSGVTEHPSIRASASPLNFPVLNHISISCKSFDGRMARMYACSRSCINRLSRLPLLQVESTVEATYPSSLDNDNGS